MILICPACHVRVRIPPLPKARLRCGGCQHVFTPMELTKATPEPPRTRSAGADFELEQEDDWDPDPRGEDGDDE